MYDAGDLHSFACMHRQKIPLKFKKSMQEKDELIKLLLKENRELKKENASLGQQNAVLAALVRTTQGINYKSDYE